jgi:hypothetical protein
MDTIPELLCVVCLNPTKCGFLASLTCFTKQKTSIKGTQAHSLPSCIQFSLTSQYTTRESPLIKSIRMALSEPPLQPLTLNDTMNMEELCVSPQQQSMSIISPVPAQMPPSNAVLCESQAIETDNINMTHKKVRFVGVPETESSKRPACVFSKQEMDLEKLMARVQQRAARRRRHNRHKRIGSPPPPAQALTLLFSHVNDAATDDAKSNGSDGLKMQAKMQLLERHLNYLEQEIQTAARMELALLNQSKALRDQREKMTKRFELMSKKMYILQQRNGNMMPLPTVATTPLPPLFNSSSSANRQPRRESWTPKQTTATSW